MQSELMDRIQPNNLDAERAVLGSAILDRSALITARSSDLNSLSRRIFTIPNIQWLSRS